jgi:hypothetical protein
LCEHHADIIRIRLSLLAFVLRTRCDPRIRAPLVERLQARPVVGISDNLGDSSVLRTGGVNMTSRIILLALILLTFETFGCGIISRPSGPIKGNLDRSGASALIKSAPRFNEGKSLLVAKTQTGGGCEYLNADRIERRLQDAGLAELKTVEDPPFMGMRVQHCQLELTEAGKKESFRQTSNSLEITVAERELLGISGIVGGEKEEAEVEYTWQWTPNGLCERLKCQTARLEASPVFFQEQKKPQRATATFRKYDDGWRPTSLGDIGMLLKSTLDFG